MPVKIIKLKAAKQSPLAKKLLASALDYAKRGFRVFPIAPNTNDAPLITEWQHKASCDPKQIKEWWATWPEANVAIATGVESGVIVVDVDVKNGKNGKSTLAALVKQHGGFTTLKARSPTGGEHHYFTSPGYKIGNRTGLVHGIDFRGDGGYIVVSPSKRKEGAYKWTNESDVATCPAWLIDLIKVEKSHAAKGEASANNKVAEGGRDVYLASLAGAMRHKGAVQEAIQAALIEQNKRVCDPPLPDEQVKKIATSIAKYSPSVSVPPTEITAEELATKDIPEPTWMVPGLLPTGLTLLAGRPKTGKSWLTLAIAIGVANGAKVLGSAVVKQGVLYLALEDTQPRLQKRLLALLDEDAPPKNLHFVTGWKRLNQGGLEELDARLSADPSIRLVVIDTFAKVRKSSKPGGNAYLEDYESIAELKAVADRHRVAMVCVLHLRKMLSADPFEMISGTTGLTGAADTNMVLMRPRNSPDTVLHITGRDVEEQALAMKFTDGKWRMLGEAEKVILTPTKKKIIAALTAATPTGPLSIGKKSGLSLSTVNKNLLQLITTGHVVQVGHGKYGPPQPSNT